MKEFTTCYIVELSGQGVTEAAHLEHLQRSIDEFIQTMLDHMTELKAPSEELKIRYGRIECTDEKNSKQHTCLRQVKLRKLDK